AACFSINALSSLAQTRRAMTAGDILRVEVVGDAQISPDGEWVAYTVSTPEGEGTRSALWIARVVTDSSQTALEAARPAARRTAPALLLPASWNASNPRWSPDSRRLAFLSSEKDETSLYVVSLENRTPRLVTRLTQTNFFITYAGESVAWSPDGKRLAFINATDESEAFDSDSKSKDPRVINRIQYKSRTSFSDTLRTHVFVIDADDERAEARQLTEGRYYDHAIAWSPRGDEIAFLSNHEYDPDANNNSDIFAVSLNGRVRQITSTPGCEYEPQWSPDGKWIAYAATRREVTTIDSVAEDAHVWVIDAQGGRGRDLTEAQDRRARSPRWSADSKSIFFLANDAGQTRIYKVPPGGGAARAMFDYHSFEIRPDYVYSTRSPGYQIINFSVANRPTPRFACSMSNATHPAEVWFGEADWPSLKRVSFHNDNFLRSFAVIEPEKISFKSFDGTTIQGWLMKPVGWREGVRYPLILTIHGGPHGMYGYQFYPSFQAYAARGYAVLYLNPRGSNGYGQKFSDGTLREWGGGDYKDLMLGVDEALRLYTWIDAERMGVAGISYGGFMTDWIITQTPRFKAAVSTASVSNLISFYSTSLYQDLIHAEFGLPWDDYDLLWRWSPLRYVRQAQTPTLFLHGEQDNDVHITQSEEMYTALKRRGVEAELVRYPREGHGFHEPRHRVDALERTLDWFDKYLK
ncbi:MAG: S9 family peptidase, partial [Acidobacteria bacterium]|nr:S9 family peptidase [Acidobacteriota bacterium]